MSSGRDISESGIGTTEMQMEDIEWLRGARPAEKRSVVMTYQLALPPPLFFIFLGSTPSKPFLAK